MRPIHYYLLGTGSWFLAYGIQSVLFAWLVTMVLRQPPQMVGVAQMTLLLPGTLLMLFGGGVADRYGGRRVAIAAQAVATLAPLLLLGMLLAERLTFIGMLAYAFVMGCVQAFITPARDGLLNQVADGRIQRTVLLASAVQFGMQILGFLIASRANQDSVAAVLAAQSLVLAAGVLGFRKVAQRPAAAISGNDRPSFLLSVWAGARTVLQHREMRLVAVQNFAMGLFFMGAFMVSLPLLVREVFAGAAAELGWMNAVNSTGLVLTILLLLRIGDLRRPGRALIVAQYAGAFVLVSVAATSSFPLCLGAVFVWGLCGGVALTMSRSIMQEQAPPEQLGRVMGFHAFSFMGAGPLGALLNGFLAAELGVQAAVAFCGLCMLAVMLVVGFRSSLWRMDTGQ